MAEQFVPKGQSPSRFNFSQEWADTPQTPEDSPLPPKQTVFEQHPPAKNNNFYGNGGGRFTYLASAPGAPGEFDMGRIRDNWTLTQKIEHTYQEQGQEIPDGTEQAELRHLLSRRLK